MELVKTVAADIQKGDRFLAGPQGPSPNRSVAKAVVETVAPERYVEVYWEDGDRISKFYPTTRVYVGRSSNLNK